MIALFGGYFLPKRVFRGVNSEEIKDYRYKENVSA
jgi:hypothetical protein